MRTTMIKVLCIIGLASFIFVSGCQSKATQERFVTEGDNAQVCRMKMLDAKENIAKWKAEEAKNNRASPVTFKDDKMALIGLLVKQQGNMNVAMLSAFTKTAGNEVDCNQIIVAMVRADAAKMAGLNNTGNTALKWIGALIGLGILTDGITDLAGSGSDSYQFRDVNMNNNAGAGGMAEGGAATMSFNAGGDTNLLGPNASQIQSEKFQDNGQNEGNPVQDDSDGNNNNPGIFN